MASLPTPDYFPKSANCSVITDYVSIGLTIPLLQCNPVGATPSPSHLNEQPYDVGDATAFYKRENCPER